MREYLFPGWVHTLNVMERDEDHTKDHIKMIHTVSAENLWLPDIIIMESCVSGWGKASMKPICKEQLRVSARHGDTNRFRLGHSLC